MSVPITITCTVLKNGTLLPVRAHFEMIWAKRGDYGDDPAGWILECECAEDLTTGKPIDLHRRFWREAEKAVWQGWHDREGYYDGDTSDLVIEVPKDPACASELVDLIRRRDFLEQSDAVEFVQDYAKSYALRANDRYIQELLTLKQTQK